MPLIQDCQWPGVLGVLSATYTVSHGISPGRWQLITLPQIAIPAEFGNLSFSDGVNPPVVLYNCHATVLTGRVTSQGQEYILEGEDERWMWRFGAGIGRYNATDQRKKLVPWTVQAPEQLASTLAGLFLSDDVGFDFSGLPTGLIGPIEDVQNYLKLGQNFPQSLTNPETIWDYVNPAEALERLANLYGCRCVYQPIARNLLIAKVGDGNDLPEGPFGYESDIPNISTTGAAPSKLVVVGSPIRFQCRFPLEAVGEDWNGMIVPIDLLTYAPVVSIAQSQRSTIKPFLNPPPATGLGVTLTFTNPANGQTVTVNSYDGGSNLSTIVAGLLANPIVSANFTITVVGTIPPYINITANLQFTVQLYTLSGEIQEYEANQTQPFQTQKNSWANAIPPFFYGVQPTARLSLLEARGLAQKSVWKMYRIRNVDPYTMEKPLNVPGFGPLVRRQQVVLQDRKVSLIVPEARIPGGTNNGNSQTGNPPSVGILPPFYNGYAREMKATCRGGVRKNLSGRILWNGGNEANANSPPDWSWNTEFYRLVPCEFSVDAEEQMIVFSDYVYRIILGAGPFQTFAAPDRLTLETACFIQDPDNNQIIRCEVERPFGGQAPPMYEIHEDVCMDVIGIYRDGTLVAYNAPGIPNAADVPNYDEAQQRAQYYLDAMAVPFQLKAGRTRQYIGIVGIDPDGQIQQVTYSVGGGATTVASSNSEHSPVVAPYPARRRAENLPPNASAAAANLLQRILTISVLPNPRSTQIDL